MFNGEFDTGIGQLSKAQQNRRDRKRRKAAQRNSAQAQCAADWDKFVEELGK